MFDPFEVVNFEGVEDVEVEVREKKSLELLSIFEGTFLQLAFEFF